MDTTDREARERRSCERKPARGKAGIIATNCWGFGSLVDACARGFSMVTTEIDASKASLSKGMECAAEVAVDGHFVAGAARIARISPQGPGRLLLAFETSDRALSKAVERNDRP